MADPLILRGLIEWDEASDGRAPLFVIDGREIGWGDFGRILAGYEGFQFKVEMPDKSEEV
ncbi:DUF7713 domain-containing protein [Methylocapsa acidiphila]|uniref:DUF7713 domain-containing protein n=1 Tax=Methylocapsa acidiphila TaxID=133552 RepID=UPI003CC9163B